MEYVGRMHKVHCTKKVIQQLQQMIFRELNLWHRLEDLLDVCLHEFQHEKDVGKVVQVFGSDYVQDLGCKLVAWHLRELAEDLNLSYDFLAVVLILKDIADEFNRHDLAGLSLFCLYNFSVAANTDELDELIIFISVPPDR